MPLATLIGGFGKMGSFFQKFLENQDFNLIICDQIRQPTKHRYEPDPHQAIRESDLIVLTTPISTTKVMLDLLLPSLEQRSDKPLIFDIASVKTPLTPIFDKIRNSPIKYVSTHPMFGPDTPPPRGRALICPLKSTQAVQEVTKIYASGGIKTTQVPLEKHDFFMSVFLSLPHLINHLFSKDLTSQHFTPDLLENLGGSTFRAQMRIAAAVAHEDPDLYFEILTKNPYTKGTLQRIRTLMDEFEKILVEEDQDSFRQWMVTNKYFMSSMGLNNEKSRQFLTED